MYKISLICAVVVLLVSECYGVPQGRRVRHQELNQAHQEHLDPVQIEQGMTNEHAKLIENLQRLKRTLEHVKEKVGKGTYTEPTKASDIKTPETAILTVLKSLQEQGQLFAMINDMIKAGSEVQNQTAKINHYAVLEEQAKAEASNAESTNRIAPAPIVAAAPISSRTTSRRGDNEIHMKMKDDHMNPAKHHGYDDYQYQYRDDGDSTGDDQYDYHYDASGYDEAPSAKGKVRKATTTTTTTTTRRPNRRVRTRGRQEYY